MGINVTHRNTAYDSYAVLLRHTIRMPYYVNTAYDSYAVLCNTAYDSYAILLIRHTIRMPYYVRFVCRIIRSHTCNMPHSYAGIWHSNEACCTYDYVMSHI